MKKRFIEEIDSKKMDKDGVVEESPQPVSVEKFFDIRVNGLKIASLGVSPSDLEELGYGYLVAEGIVDSYDQIKTVEVRGDEIHTFVQGLVGVDDLNEVSHSGCIGVSWDDDAEEISVKSDLELSSSFLFEVLPNLNSDVYRNTRGSHSASIVDEEGNLVAKAVDVGKHTAYDKVIGKALAKNVNLSGMIILSTGRQSAGMVMKTARVGVPVIVTKAAPLTSGVEAAKKTGVSLVCFAENGRLKVFTGFDRIDIEK